MTAIKESKSADSQPYRILSLDGGGVHALAYLPILEEIEVFTGRPIRDSSFDMVVGTSTGAIVATALSLGFRAREIKELYLKLATTVFGKESSLSGWLRKLFHFYSSEPLRQELEKAFTSKLKEKATWHDLAIELRQNRKNVELVVVLWNVSERRATYLSTDLGRSPGDALHGAELAGILTACCSAPAYFPIRRFNEDNPRDYSDGGVTGLNNPSALGLSLAYRSEANRARTFQILSLGCGPGKPQTQSGTEKWWLYDFVIKNTIQALMFSTSSLLYDFFKGFGAALRVERHIRLAPDRDEDNEKLDDASSGSLKRICGKLDAGKFWYTYLASGLGVDSECGTENHESSSADLCDMNIDHGSKDTPAPNNPWKKFSRSQVARLCEEFGLNSDERKRGSQTDVFAINCPSTVTDKELRGGVWQTPILRLSMIIFISVLLFSIAVLATTGGWAWYEAKEAASAKASATLARTEAKSAKDSAARAQAEAAFANESAATSREDLKRSVAEEARLLGHEFLAAAQVDVATGDTSDARLKLAAALYCCDDPEVRSEIWHRKYMPSKLVQKLSLEPRWLETVAASDGALELRWLETVAVSPDGKLLCALSNSGDLAVWEKKEDRFVGLRINPQLFEKEKQPGRDINFMSASIDSEHRRVALGGYDNRGSHIWIVSIDRMKIDSDLEHSEPVDTLAFSKNGRWLASGPRVLAGAVSIWDTNAATWRRVQIARSSRGGAVAFDDKSTAFAVADGQRLRSWRITTGNPETWSETTIEIPPIPAVGAISCVIFDPNRHEQIAIGTEGGYLFNVDLQRTDIDLSDFVKFTGPVGLVESLGGDSVESCFALVGDRYEGHHALWDLCSGTQLMVLARSSHFNILSPAGEWFVTRTNDNKELQVWQCNSMDGPMKICRLNGLINDVRFHPKDGSIAVLVQGHVHRVCASDGRQLKSWNTGCGDDRYSGKLAFSENGGILAVSGASAAKGDESTVRFFHVDGDHAMQIGRDLKCNNKINSLFIAGGDRKLLVGSKEDTSCLVPSEGDNEQVGNVRIEEPSYSETCLALAVSLDQKWAAAWLVGRGIEVQSVEQYGQIGVNVFSGNSPNPPSLALSPDGSLLAAGSALWQRSAVGWQRVERPADSKFTTLDVEFSRKGDYLAAVGILTDANRAYCAALRIWSTADWTKPIVDFRFPSRGSGGRWRLVRFEPNGKQLAVALNRGGVLVFDLNTLLRFFRDPTQRLIDGELESLRRSRDDMLKLDHRLMDLQKWTTINAKGDR